MIKRKPVTPKHWRCSVCGYEHPKDDPLLFSHLHRIKTRRPDGTIAPGPWVCRGEHKN